MQKQHRLGILREQYRVSAKLDSAGNGLEVLYNWTSTDMKIIEMLQVDGSGAVKKMIADNFAKERDKNCSNADSIENIVTQESYNLVYTYYSPEGWELFTATIENVKC